jgi:hypothetical protein
VKIIIIKQKQAEKVLSRCMAIKCFLNEKEKKIKSRL